MDIFYTNETLYVNIDNRLYRNLSKTLQERVFKIVKDYDIDNIVLNTGGNILKEDKELVEFIDEYEKIHSGNLKVI